MSGRFLAICGWVASLLERRIAATPPGRRLGSRRIMVGLLAVLGVAFLMPVVVAYAQPQPADAGVEEVRLGMVQDAADWVRLRGKLVSLPTSPVAGPGAFALLVDEDDPLEAVVVHASERIAPATAAMVTGHLRPAVVTFAEDLPIEATQAGTPPQIVTGSVVDLDPIALPERVVLWPITLLGAVVLGVLAIGLRSGYPVFRAAHEMNVLAQPLSPGDRLPIAVAGRIGPHTSSLADPAGALITVGPGPRGGVLTVQLLGDGRGAEDPVEVGGGWTDGRVGYVHTIDETVPALAVRSEHADAVLLFARTTERDRAAGLVSVER